METNGRDEALRNRNEPLEMTPNEFRKVGYRVIDQIAELLASLSQRPVTSGESPQEVRSMLGNEPMPKQGTPPDHLFEETTNLLFEHSLFNGHPRFWGYITSSASPSGALADLLAASVNPNVGGWTLSPMATEIEAQTIRWIANLIGYPVTCGGLLVSGGNMANFVGFLAARTSKVPWNIREEGIGNTNQRLIVYGSKATHTWIEKATDLFGLGTNAMRWIDTNIDQQMDVNALERQILSDQADDYLPFLVVGAAGTVGIGAVDPLPEIAAICRQHNLWFHVDGAYGAPAAALPEASPQLKGLVEADSVALDPHKWLYSPLEAGCILVRKSQILLDTFSFHPEYYSLDNLLNYYEFGPQNSRGFRALKVWLGLRQAGQEGYIEMIRNDIALAEALYHLADSHSELQAITQSLSITTFRYIPNGLAQDEPETIEAYLNTLNKELLSRLQKSGEAFVSNAVMDGKYVLRACIVNFRTTLDDIEALPKIVVRIGRMLDAELRPEDLRVR
jgi:glutamate/tyrosine decarboxylase-like PLP-dependent enzyme